MFGLGVFLLFWGYFVFLQPNLVSPVIANLDLHEAFDSWMAETFPNIEWERYADDIIVHCASEEEARLERIKARLAEYKLRLHPEKTRMVYTGTGHHHNPISRTRMEFPAFPCLKAKQWLLAAEQEAIIETLANISVLCVRFTSSQ